MHAPCHVQVQIGAQVQPFVEDNRKSYHLRSFFFSLIFISFEGSQEQICCQEIISSTLLLVKFKFTSLESLFYHILIHILVLSKRNRTPICSLSNVRYTLCPKKAGLASQIKYLSEHFHVHYVYQHSLNTCRLECNNSARHHGNQTCRRSCKSQLYLYK